MWPFRPMIPTKPWGLRWRSSAWFVTFMVFLGLMSDTIVYSIIIPIMPFRLEKMGYHHISSRLGWLLFAYSAGVVLSTPPLASFSERYKNRKIPLVLAIVALILSMLLLMLGNHYWIMCVARIIQGVSSSGIFTAGIALICDTTPKKRIGQYIGITMAGFSLGLLVGPPIGGTLFASFGYKAPFYFAMGFAALDLIARLLIIERKDAVLWGVDPAADPNEAEKPNPVNSARVLSFENRSTSVGSFCPPSDISVKTVEGPETVISRAPADDVVQHVISPLDVLLRLLTSPRAVVCIFSTFVYGLVYSGQESVLILHLSDVYNLDASKAGLAFMAAVVPTLISMPLAGYIADNKGTEWVSFLSLLLGIPWWGVITMKSSLAQFLVVFAFETLFTSGLVSPLMTELAAVSRSIEGVGYAHVYGSFNLAYGVGSGVGPVLCGQIYDNVGGAWTVISLITLGLLVVCLLLTVTFTGERPLLRRVPGPFFKQGRSPTNAWDMTVLGGAPLPEPEGHTGSCPKIPSIPLSQPMYGEI